jgi:hypothetical protein
MTKPHQHAFHVTGTQYHTDTHTSTVWRRCRRCQGVDALEIEGKWLRPKKVREAEGFTSIKQTVSQEKTE